MGITNNNFKFLLNNIKLFKNKKLITIGRQQKYFDLNNFKKNDLIKKNFLNEDFRNDFYIDNVFRKISNNNVTSLDFSEDRGKTNIKFNLNEAIPKKYYNKFDILIDGGSLEHILDLKNCIQNYQKLVKKNGHLFIFTTANNYFGHGFYQFSLEFFNNIFSSTNGFKILDIILCEHNFPGAELSKKNNWYRPRYNKENKYKRFSVINNSPIMIYILIKKVKNTKVSFNFVQSDYLENIKKIKNKSNLKQFLVDNIKKNKKLFDFIYGVKQKKEYKLSNKKFFIKVEN